MKTSITSLLLVLASTSAFSVLACDVPVAPPTPDGSSATLEEMIAAQGEVKAFQAANAEYLECVDDQMASEKAAIDEGDDSAEGDADEASNSMASSSRGAMIDQHQAKLGRVSRAGRRRHGPMLPSLRSHGTQTANRLDRQATLRRQKT